jgi:hypothetical protein
MRRAIGLLVSFAIAAYAATKLFARADAASVLTWFVAALLLHDLVVLPLYSAFDALVLRRLGAGAVNHVRVPLAIAAVLALVYFPSILRLNAPAYRHATGLSPDVYLGRWLAITGALFAASALIGLTRLCRRAARRRAPAPAAARAPGAGGERRPPPPPRR